MSLIEVSALFLLIKSTCFVCTYLQMFWLKLELACYSKCRAFVETKFKDIICLIFSSVFVEMNILTDIEIFLLQLSLNLFNLLIFYFFLLEACLPFSFLRNNQFSAHTFRAQKIEFVFIIFIKENRAFSCRFHDWRKRFYSSKVDKNSWTTSFFVTLFFAFSSAFDNYSTTLYTS